MLTAHFLYAPFAGNGLNDLMKLNQVVLANIAKTCCHDNLVLPYLSYNFVPFQLKMKGESKMYVLSTS